MSRLRRVLGPPGRGVGAWRFPLTTVLAVGVAAFAALSGDYLTAAVALALAVVMGTLTLRGMREDGR